MTDAPETIRPETADQVLEAMHWAIDHENPLRVEGLSSKRHFGGLVDAKTTLDLSKLTGVELYEPAELVITAKAGTPWETIQTLLSKNNQQLNFEPQDLSHLLGSTRSRGNASGTIGGIVACNLSGPRRIQTGAARDHLLGFTAVSGQANLFKSGGRVMKNVTGFDLSKLMAGSFGTLGVMTEVTFKVMPKPEKSRTVLVFGADNARSVKVMSRALGSNYEVSAAAHLPKPIAQRSNVDFVANAGTSVTAIRVEGPGLSVESRCASLKDLLGKELAVEELHTQKTETLWREIRDASFFRPADETSIWRVSVAPTHGHDVAAKINAFEAGETYFDWGGGLVWMAFENQKSAQAKVIRDAVDEVGGHATLIRKPPGSSSIEPFHRRAPALDALQSRIKQAFDPKGLLNPGRTPGLV